MASLPELLLEPRSQPELSVIGHNNCPKSVKDHQLDMKDGQK